MIVNSLILSTAKSSVPRGFRKKEMKEEAGARNVNIYISHILTLDVDSYLIHIGKTSH